jgi:glycosyltransferase involved in cell wall biosynthesis
MHSCFLTYGSWQRNAGMIRPKHLGTALIECGHQVSYIVDDLPFNRAELDLDPRAHVVYVPHSRSIWQIPARRRAIRQLQPDFIHVLNSHPKTFLALAGIRGQKIVGEWDEPPTLKDLGRARNAMEWFVDRWLRRRASVRIACTSFVQEHFRDRYGLQTTYVPHAPYLPVQDDGESPFDRPTAVYMGNLYQPWDHDVVFHAAVLLKKRGLTPPILIMGDGPEMGRWKSFIAEQQLDNVSLPGFISDRALWLRLRHAHVLLFPIRDTVINRSRCPSKVFAYAQARRPIITSPVGELPYMLGPDPVYIESTAEAFADAMEKAMTHPPLPDVSYKLDRHSWAERCQRLVKALSESGGGS